MSQAQNTVVNNPAFRIDKIDVVNGETIVVIRKEIIGALANQLKNTDDRRKGFTILRKLGYVLADCGDVQYGADVSGTNIDPKIVGR